MKKTICVWLAVVLLLTLCACGTKAPAASATAVVTGGDLGEGSVSFTVQVVDGEGNMTEITIHTDEKMVGDALQAVNLLAGEMGDYGLYVKTVNGITADYDTDGTYWAFYINGEYAATGVDTTAVEQGAVYRLEVTTG